MDFAAILTQLGEGFVSFGPSFAQGIWLIFLNLFCTFTELEGVYTVTGLNLLGQFSMASIVIGITYKTAPIAINWISKKARSFRKRRRA